MAQAADYNNVDKGRAQVVERLERTLKPSRERDELVEGVVGQGKPQAGTPPADLPKHVQKAMREAGLL
jgi:hypothetical protein